MPRRSSLILLVFLGSVRAAAAAECPSPVATLLEPAIGRRFSGGETIAFSATATDGTGAAVPASGFTWRVEAHVDGEPRPFLAPARSLTSGTFTVPTVFHTTTDLFFRVHLTVVNACGQAQHQTRDVAPRLSTITLTTEPPALELGLDGARRRAPVTFTGVAGVVRRISARDDWPVFDGNVHMFQSWSDGGYQDHDLVTPPTDTTITATFAPISSCANVVPSDGLFRPTDFNPSMTKSSTVQFSARPSTAPMNGVVGFARFQEQMTHSQYAALVRFNPAGHIDARNGSSYTAERVIPYTAGVMYNFRVEVDQPAHRYSVFVRPDGATSEIAVGRNLAFRTEQRSVDYLLSWGAWVATSPTASLQVCAVREPTNHGCFAVKAPHWYFQEVLEAGEVEGQGGRFDATFEVTPSHAPMNGVVAIGKEIPVDYTGFACLARFAPSGRIDARDGDVYRALSAIPYSAGVKYRFRLAVDSEAHKYSIFVRPDGASSELTVGRDFDFRTEQRSLNEFLSWGARASEPGHALVLCGLENKPIADCALETQPAAPDFPSSGGTGSFEVGAPLGGSGCTYEAVSASSFITIVAGQTGPGFSLFPSAKTVSYTVSPNSGPARTGTIRVNGRTFTVMQAGR